MAGERSGSTSGAARTQRPHHLRGGRSFGTLRELYHSNTVGRFLLAFFSLKDRVVVLLCVCETDFNVTPVSSRFVDLSKQD